MRELHDLLRLCDEHIYLNNQPHAFEDLCSYIASSASLARELLLNLTGCPRTVRRHAAFLQAALTRVGIEHSQGEYLVRALNGRTE
jgi:hypothetical protein